MEAKKTQKADLENKKGLFLEIGLVVIIAATLLAFNWKSYDIEELEVSNRTVANELEEEIIQTQEDQPEPEMPEPEAPEPSTEFEEVDDNKEIENQLVINAEDNANLAQEAYVAPTVTTEEVEVEEEIEVFVEKDPEFPGGTDALLKYLAENIQYPDQARATNIEGKVYIEFVVEKDGRVTNVVIKRDIGAGCGKEAARVVQAMPKWTPGEKSGKRVRSRFTVPVTFKLK